MASTASAQQARGVVVVNEIHYHPVEPGTSFVEIHNTSASIPFDVSGWELRGTGFVFPASSSLGPGAFAVIVANRIEFARLYGVALLPVGEFAGSLENGGEMLRLIQPGATPGQEIVVDEVRYDDDPPWPSLPDGGGTSLQLIDPAQDHNRAGNWGSALANDPVRSTPGFANSVRASIPPFPNVWLNEVAPENGSGVLDSFGDADPWVELHNPGPGIADLSGLYLSASTANLLQWAFPSATSLAAGGFLVVWLDGETSESSSTELHANFKPTPTQGTLILSRQQGSASAGLDGLNYSGVTPGRSFGSYPDGPTADRRVFHFPTLSAANNPRSISTSVKINEWMASNTSTFKDSADGHFEDWFELYNSAPTPVDLSGYYLTDTLTNKVKFPIPTGWTIPALGYLLVWADEETAQNAAHVDLHVNFKLAASGEAIGLYAPDGTSVDAIEFGPQANDVSEARFPDGALAPFRTTRTATPKMPNLVPPLIVSEPADAIADSDSTVMLSVRISGSSPVAYQWRKGTSAIPGATEQDLILTNLQTSQGGTYSVLVSNSSGSVVSREMTLTVRPPAIPTVLFECASIRGARGVEVIVPIVTRSFASIASAQFSVQWDPTVLAFKSVEQFGLVGLAAGSFGTEGVTGGAVVFSWDDPGGTGQSLGDGATVFTIRFTLVGAAGSVSSVRFASSPLPIEIVAIQGGKPSTILMRGTEGSVRILDTLQLSGKVRYYTLDRPVPGATVDLLSESDVRVLGVSSAVDGAFTIVTQTGGPHSLRASYPGDTSGAQGVTTLDITLIRRHILGIQVLDSPYKLIAADVNGSGSVSTLDISLIRRYILGIDAVSPAGIWRFIPSNYLFPNSNNPWSADTRRFLQSLDHDQAGLDFIGVKIGDVNGSWTPPGSP